MSNCEYRMNQRSKCKLKVTHINRFGYKLCKKHLDKYEEEYKVEIEPKYRSLTLPRHSASNYRFYMFIYRELKKKYILLSKYIWLDIIKKSRESINLMQKFRHLDTGKILVVERIEFKDEKISDIFLIDLETCSWLYERYHFVWIDYLQMFVPWNDQEPIETRYIRPKKYAGHPKNQDKSIINSRYNGLKYELIPLVPPPYISRLI